MIWFDPTYLFLVMIPSLIVALWAQFKVQAALNRFSRVPNTNGLSGAEAAEAILGANGLHDVRIEMTHGFLGDHYDPYQRVLRLSPQVYRGRSLAAVGIAAHEAGHALQQAHAYAPLALRTAIVPLAAFSNLAWPLLVLGLAFRITLLINLGILFFLAVVLLQLINLPVEYNASRRAREALLALGIVSPYEDRGVKAVLNAAALTYVAAALGAVLQLLYFIGLARRE